MKLVFLVEADVSEYEKLIDELNDKHKKSIFIDTNNCDEEREYTYLLNNIHVFSQSPNEIMLARFSGNDSVSRNLGDECSEMILVLSQNKQNANYTECIKSMFLNLLDTFKGD